MSKAKNKELLPFYKRAKKTLEYDYKTGVFSRWIEGKKEYKEAGSINPKGYRMISVTIDGIKKTLKAHRIAWYYYYGELPNLIDHIDGDKLNNSIFNLRSCTNQQNQQNKGIFKNNKTGYKGVFMYREGFYTATIAYNNKRIYLGSFNCPKKASEVYEEKAKELFGEFYRHTNS